MLLGASHQSIEEQQPKEIIDLRYVVSGMTVKSVNILIGYFLMNFYPSLTSGAMYFGSDFSLKSPKLSSAF